MSRSGSSSEKLQWQRQSAVCTTALAAPAPSAALCRLPAAVWCLPAPCCKRTWPPGWQPGCQPGCQPLSALSGGSSGSQMLTGRGQKLAALGHSGARCVGAARCVKVCSTLWAGVWRWLRVGMRRRRQSAASGRRQRRRRLSKSGGGARGWRRRNWERVGAGSAWGWGGAGVLACPALAGMQSGA